MISQCFALLKESPQLCQISFFHRSNTYFWNKCISQLINENNYPIQLLIFWKVSGKLLNFCIKLYSRTKIFLLSCFSVWLALLLDNFQKFLQFSLKCHVDLHFSSAPSSWEICLDLYTKVYSSLKCFHLRLAERWRQPACCLQLIEESLQRGPSAKQGFVSKPGLQHCT